MSQILLLQKSYRNAFSNLGHRLFHKVYDSNIKAYPKRKEPSELRRKQAAENLKANRVSRHLFSEDSLSDEGVMYLKLITQCKFDKHLTKCFKILEHCRQRKEVTLSFFFLLPSTDHTSTKCSFSPKQLFNSKSQLANSFFDK